MDHECVFHIKNTLKNLHGNPQYNVEMEKRLYVIKLYTEDIVKVMWVKRNTESEGDPKSICRITAMGR